MCELKLIDDADDWLPRLHSLASHIYLLWWRVINLPKWDNRCVVGLRANCSIHEVGVSVASVIHTVLPWRISAVSNRRRISSFLSNYCTLDDERSAVSSSCPGQTQTSTGCANKTVPCISVKVERIRANLSKFVYEYLVAYPANFIKQPIWFNRYSSLKFSFSTEHAVTHWVYSQRTNQTLHSFSNVSLMIVSCLWLT